MHRTAQRPARANLVWLTFIASILLFVALAAFLGRNTIAGWFASEERPRSLVVFCAAGLRSPVEKIAKQYQEETGVEVQLQYGGSNTLLANLQYKENADLFIPADDDYAHMARTKGLIDEAVPLATMRPVLIVRKGNPLKIASLDDILTRDVRVSHANPEAAAVGKVSQDALVAAGKWDGYKKRIKVNKPTVNDVAADVQLGAVDAAIIWDALASQLPEIEVVPAPALANARATLSACIVRSGTQPTAALRFARYLAARDRGLPVFKEFGYTTSRGDQWTATPELTLMAGAMLRPAIDKTVTTFEEREGITVKRIYNGCGILVSQMLADRPPDIYFACDRSFLDRPTSSDPKVRANILKVKSFFEEPEVVTGNQLVILVKKGNPHNIKRLRDLGQKGLRLGIGHEKECALGQLTQTTLETDNTRDPVMKNVKVISVTGDVLVAQLRYGSLDAVIAYISNAAGSADVLEAIPIDIPCAFAEQPYAVNRESEHRQLAGRLLAAIRTEDSKKRFEAYGFTWGGAPAGKEKP